MAKLPQSIATSEPAKLWRATGRGELAERLERILHELEGTSARKQLPTALGISTVSFYSVLKGQGTYGLFLQQIAKSELERQERLNRATPVSSDSLLNESQWRRLDLLGLIAKYAPHLLGENDSPLPSSPPTAPILPSGETPPFRNEIFEVAQDLVEDLTPSLIRLATHIHHALRVKGVGSSAADSDQPFLKRTDEIEVLQQAVDALAFPAGILENSTTSTLLGCNERLCDLFQVPPEALLQQSLGNLIGIATQRIPATMQAEFHGLLSRRMGARVARSEEKSPLCFQYYLNVRGSRFLSEGCYRVSALAVPALTFGTFGEDLAIFLYHLKASGPIRA